MSSQLEDALFQGEESEADITVAEYKSEEAGILTDSARRYLEQKVNGGETRDGDRIQVSFDYRGHATVTATSYVGIVSLPEGPTIEIQPKANGTHLLNLLRYAQGVEATTFDQQTRVQRGNVFIEAIAALFEAELATVLNRGLHTSYRTVERQERNLRGRLDLQRQLQRQPPQATAFECTYDELTPDVTINQAILYATSILIPLVQDQNTINSLQRHQQTLRRSVTLRPVTPRELEQIEVNRLNEYYEDLLRFTEMIIRNVHIAELTAGRRSSFSLLVNMNTVFENAVERAAKTAAATRSGWSAKGQDDSKYLINEDDHSVKLKPDFTIRDSDNVVRVVGDAKWKTDSPSNSDFYQMTAYTIAHDAPGVLVYPEQGKTMSGTCKLPTGKKIHLVEISTNSNNGSFEAFCNGLREDMDTTIESLIDE